jgi:hypothetical protein
VTPVGATNNVAPSRRRDCLAAVGALRRRVAAQSSVDAGEGVKARRALFALDWPAGDPLAALRALDDFERAIVERHDRVIVEARRLKCLAVLDGLLGT